MQPIGIRLVVSACIVVLAATWGWTRSFWNSSCVNGLGLDRMCSGTASLPMSCSNAAAMTPSASAVARGNVATMRPPRTTRMRSLTPRISGRSDEIIRIATPRAARSAMMR